MKNFVKFMIIIRSIAIVSFVLSATSDALETALIMDSDSDDYIGDGSQYFYTTADGAFTAQNHGGSGVTISFQAPNYTHFWYLDFAAPNNSPLTVGFYSGATRYPFQDADAPGLSVYGDGRGCNTSKGSFEIKQIAYGAANDIVAFWATFEQHCEGNAPALRGEIRFNADAPDATTVISSFPNPSIIGQPITFTARVYGAGAPPTGSISIMDASSVLWTGFLSGSPATAVFTTSSLPAGTYEVTAQYEGDNDFSPSSSSVLKQAVEKINATVLTIDSDPGDVNGPSGYSYTLTDGTFTAQNYGDNEVSISFRTTDYGNFWYLVFAAPNGGPLTVGAYPGATRYPSQGTPGLAIYGDGGGCNTSTGSFEIKQLVYDTANAISAFSAAFEQYSCDGSASALKGKIRLHANVDVLTITKTGSGNGDVKSDSETIQWIGNSGAATYDGNTPATLTASAADNSVFTGWEGCDSTNGNQCTVSMETDRAVTAAFALKQYALTVNKSGACDGNVKSIPMGIDCGLVCSAQYNQGAVLTLTTIADNGCIFTGWDGGGCTGSGTCSTTLNQDTAITAAFTALQAGIPKISIQPDSLNFGSVQTGSMSAPKVITIKNKGKGSLIIHSITLAGINADDFIQTNSCPVISPGSSCNVNVTFKPELPLGKKKAAISIASNDLKHPTINAKVSGQAAPNLSIAGAWDIKGQETVKVSIKGKSRTEKMPLSDEFIFSDNGYFGMTDMNGTWSQNGNKFFVHLDTQIVQNYFLDALRDQIGTGVSAEVATLSFAGSVQKNGTIKGALKLHIDFYVPAYRLQGKATASATFTGARQTANSSLSIKERQQTNLSGSVLKVMRDELDKVIELHDSAR